LIQINALWRRCGSLAPSAGRRTFVPRRSEHAPTDDAPATGRYGLLNIFGTPTGEAMSASKGERLPAAPLGNSWRLIAIDEPLEVARRRVLEGQRRIVRQKTVGPSDGAEWPRRDFQVRPGRTARFSRFTPSREQLCRTPQGVPALILPSFRWPASLAA
jgi:hypothetical protein